MKILWTIVKALMKCAKVQKNHSFGSASVRDLDELNEYRYNKGTDRS